MAKARKLPSGSWRCLVYDYTDNSEKRHYKSFTANTKRDAEFLAAQYAATKESIIEIDDITLGEAMERYIKNRSSVLSPSTIREYQNSRKRDLQCLMDINIKN